MPCSASTTPNAPHSSTGQFESAQDEKPGFEESEDGAKKGSCDRDSTAQDIRNINKKIKIAGSDTEFKTMKCDDYSAGKEHKEEQDDSDLFLPLFDCQMFRDLQYKVPSRTTWLSIAFLQHGRASFNNLEVQTFCCKGTLFHCEKPRLCPDAAHSSVLSISIISKTTTLVTTSTGIKASRINSEKQS
ncbi:hypothetical protein BGZ99_001090 [Dissophora globulifera]|uniref:Uncharacterized protein n=1 Tax=Dissophora globulifera TaxID=979702 RepID=A0A9P6RRS8_9FUNG|nr:hypothetical protein BGZ99_001090 [Dissophora globulifera]